MKKIKDVMIVLGMIAVILFTISIPISMAVGKYQVCSLYFPEMNRYACLFTNLPPYTGVKK